MDPHAQTPFLSEPSTTHIGSSPNELQELQGVCEKEYLTLSMLLDKLQNERLPKDEQSLFVMHSETLCVWTEHVHLFRNVLQPNFAFPVAKGSVVSGQALQGTKFDLDP